MVTAADIARVLMQQSPARMASTPFSVSEYPVRGPEMTAHQPDLRERVGNAVYDVFGAFGLPSIANRARNEAQTGVDFVPGLGDAVGFDDARQAFNAGNYGEAAANAGLSAVGLIPGGGDVAAGVGKAIFGGIAAKTADKAALAKAQELAASGADRDAIWNATGWFKGPDDAWRFEIDDRTAFTKGYGPMSDIVTRQGDTAGNVMRHPELWEAYPDVANSGIETFNAAAAKKGFFQGSDGRSTPIVGVNDGLRGDALGSTMLHELQHAVQAKEGFDTGGRTRDALDAFTAHNSSKVDKVSSEISRIMVENPTMAALYRRRNQAMIAKDFDMVDAIEERMGGMPEGSRVLDLDWERGVLSSAGEQPPSAKDAYRRLAGEVEARNVQSRMNMTAEQRRRIAPWETEDVPFSEQIVRNSSR